jgi:phage-related protein
MAKSLSSNLIIEKNRVHGKDAWIVLLTITLADASGTTLRFARDNQDVVFDGNTYTAFNFDFAPPEQNSEADLHPGTLRVSGISRILQPYLEQLDGPYGATFVLTVIHRGSLAESYAELQDTYDVHGCICDERWVTFTLGPPSLLMQRYPLQRYFAGHCTWQFEGAECQYVRQSVTAVTLAASDPVIITVPGHGFATDDVIRLAAINGITPSLAGNWIATYASEDTFSLQDSDSSNYSGSYSGGGTAGYATCERTLTACRQRGNSGRFGGHKGLQPGGIRLVG